MGMTCTTQSLLEQIRNRRAEIARRKRTLVAEMNEIIQQMLLLEREDAHLSVSERNAGIAPESPQPPPREWQNVTLGSAVTTVITKIEPSDQGRPRERRKPKEVPSVVTMARDVLREATARGTPWVEGDDILDAIKTRWWPDARAEDVKPQLWRAASVQKVLAKNGSRFALPYAIEKGSAELSAEPLN